MNFIGLFLVCTIALGLLLAHDASQWFASKTTDFLYNDNLEGMHNPDYDKAEEVALSGRHLEAIQLLRDFLKKNPSELYAQIRIAELYEGELKNYLAAALEYEEVLKHKFHPERWGWAAIHLVNLYAGRLDQPDKATAWLRRIETEYPTTGPAKKAREKLGSPEPTVASAEQKDDRPPSGSGGLPPGFSPKKR